MATSFVNLAGLMRKSGRLLEAERMVLGALRDLESETNGVSADHDDDKGHKMRFLASSKGNYDGLMTGGCSNPSAARLSDVVSAKQLLDNFRVKSVSVALR